MVLDHVGTMRVVDGSGDHAAKGDQDRPADQNWGEAISCHVVEVAPQGRAVASALSTEPGSSSRRTPAEIAPASVDRVITVTTRSTLGDVAIAAAPYLLFTVPVLGAHEGQGPAWAIAVLGAVVCAPLALRRRWPSAVAVTVVVGLCVAALCAVRFTPFVSNAGPALGVAAYTLAATRSRRSSLRVTVGLLICLSVFTAIGYGLHPHTDQDAVQWLIAIPAWLVGDTVRVRRGYQLEVVREHEARAVERDGRIRAEERLRVSREVHDVVSHTLSMIALRSGVARTVADRNPDEVRAALAAIESASRTALDELRGILRDIRDVAPTGHPDEPTLADVQQLAETARAGGLDVELTIEAQPGDKSLPPMLEMTVYRIVQESLTNVAKHAQARRVWIDIGAEGDSIRVSVVDDGVGRPTDAVEGIGTAGMRERVELFGGSLDLDAGPGGIGHRVAATFPLAMRS